MREYKRPRPPPHTYTHTYMYRMFESYAKSPTASRPLPTTDYQLPTAASFKKKEKAKQSIRIGISKYRNIEYPRSQSHPPPSAQPIIHQQRGSVVIDKKRTGYMYRLPKRSNIGGGGGGSEVEVEFEYDVQCIG